MSRSVEFVLTEDERGELERWSRGSSRLAVRARIVLRCAEPDVVYPRVAADLDVSEMTVGKCRKRFAQSRLEGLEDADRSGRPKAVLVLTDVERAQLTRWARRAKTSQALALRARIVLACADEASNKEVAVRLGTTASMVTRWRRRFVESRLDGLADELRPGRPAPRCRLARTRPPHTESRRAACAIRAATAGFTPSAHPIHTCTPPPGPECAAAAAMPSARATETNTSAHARSWARDHRPRTVSKSRTSRAEAPGLGADLAGEMHRHRTHGIHRLDRYLVLGRIYIPPPARLPLGSSTHQLTRR
ncbi:helix-turn-helix domain-containing protein [Embleya sp. NPDC050493]|uniref:helix-turn-helix domain-containing protein n=1 Tax=Embleya sp. NPDC050493 TaxID=3363989 RepID=UPI0037B4CCB0